MSRDASQPTPEAWQALREAALAFRESAPWRWMREADVFALRSPMDGELAFGCVFGHHGDVIGFGLYLGAEGLAGLRRILTGGYDAERPMDALEAYVEQHCLLVTFDDDPEADLLEPGPEAGVSGAADPLQPHYRAHRPGCEPWSLQGEEASLLTMGLQQALVVSQGLRRSPGLLTPPTGDVLFARVPDLTLEGHAWHDAWVALPRPREDVGEDFEVGVERLRALRALPQATGGPRLGEEAIWELDFTVSPLPVQESPAVRPRYPYVLLVVDQRSGSILQDDVAEHDQRLTTLRELLLRAMEDVRYRPMAVWVRREAVAEALARLVDCLDIDVELVERLSAAEPAQVSVAEELRSAAI